MRWTGEAWKAMEKSTLSPVQHSTQELPMPLTVAISPVTSTTSSSSPGRPAGLPSRLGSALEAMEFAIRHRSSANPVGLRQIHPFPAKPALWSPPGAPHRRSPAAIAVVRLLEARTMIGASVPLATHLQDPAPSPARPATPSSFRFRRQPRSSIAMAGGRFVSLLVLKAFGV